MAASKEYADFVCEQLSGFGTVRSKKMFGEYMVYIDEKPLLLVCIADIMQNAETGYPYDGAKLHYILDIENKALCESVISTLLSVIPVPKPKKSSKCREH